MRTLLLLSALLGCAFPLLSQRVLITGIVDGTASGGLPKAIELYVDGTVNLEDYTLTRFANGGTSPGNIPLTGTYTDRFVYVINSSSANVEAFTAAFGTAGDFADPLSSGNVSGNGNDQFVLSLGEAVIDATGGSRGDDSNAYQDGYLYRNDNTGPTPAFERSEWTGGNDLLDGLSLEEIGEATPFGTYLRGPVGPSVTATGEADLAEPATKGGFSILLSEIAGTPVTVTYAFGGTATEGTDYVDANGGSVTIAPGEISTAIVLNVIDDQLIEGDETIDLTITSVSETRFAIGGGASISIIDEDLFGTVLISTVQGDGDVSPLVGATLTVEAIVIGDFPGGNGEGLRGFYVQEEADDSDRDSTTSEGLFVFSPAEVSLGDLVSVTGEVSEFGEQTQISATSVTVVSSGFPLPEAISFSLPRSAAYLESLEGMRVAPTGLVVTDNFNLARFGEVSVTSDERLIQFTECNEPSVAGLIAYTAAQELDVIRIDDGRNGTNAAPILLPDGSLLSATNTLRAGQTIENLTGVLGYGFNAYRVQPTPTSEVTFGGNDRPTAAPTVGGEVTVVSANVLNYFTTLGRAGRGADNELEFERQQAKIVNALCELSADIVGLIEIENNDYVALQNLVDAINAQCGTNYTYVISPNTGDDAIMVALMYKADRVEESGTAAALATPEEIFVGPGTNRVPLAQTFRVIDPRSKNFGQELTVCVNHFKSKGSGCNDNTGDGSGNCNTVRDAAARAVTEWLATNPTGVAEEDVLLIGDLNAYRMEDPIQTILAAGYFNTKVAVSDPNSFPCGGGAASYGFQGQWGSLDYALASNSLADKLTGAATWGVNSAEPVVLDYNTEGLGADLYAPDFYRFSDHDPILVGLDLGPALTEDITDFTATPFKNKVKLQWKTTPGITAQYIAVERLDAAGNFRTIGTVKVSGGNSNGNRNYVYNDQGAAAGSNTYRLKLVEQDGTARYTEELTVLLAGKQKLTQLEQVAGASYRVVDFAAGSIYRLIGLSGQTLSSGVLEATGGLISTQGLPTGLYIVHVVETNGQHSATKVAVR